MSIWPAATLFSINKQPVNGEDEFRKIESEPEERAGRGLPGSPARFVPSGWHDLPGRYTSVMQIAQRNWH